MNITLPCIKYYFKYFFSFLSDLYIDNNVVDNDLCACRRKRQFKLSNPFKYNIEILKTCKCKCVLVFHIFSKLQQQNYFCHNFVYTHFGQKFQKTPLCLHISNCENCLPKTNNHLNIDNVSSICINTFMRIIRLIKCCAYFGDQSI